MSSGECGCVGEFLVVCDVFDGRFTWIQRGYTVDFHTYTERSIHTHSEYKMRPTQRYINNHVRLPCIRCWRVNTNAKPNTLTYCT